MLFENELPRQSPGNIAAQHTRRSLLEIQRLLEVGEDIEFLILRLERVINALLRCCDIFPFSNQITEILGRAVMLLYSGVDKGGLGGAENPPIELNCHFVGKLLILSEMTQFSISSI